MKAEVTELLIDLRQGERTAIDRLFPLVYETMKDLARLQISKEYDEITLKQTELVHEVFLKMVDQTRIQAQDRNHFYAIASRCMRQILVDQARKRKAEKRGGDQHSVTFDESRAVPETSYQNLIEIDRHLDELKHFDERMANIVELRFFGGLPNASIAEVLGISEKTVIRDWMHAKGWLYKRIRQEQA